MLFIFFASSFLFADRVRVWSKNLFHENSIIRKNSAIYLGQIGDSRAIKPLRSALLSEKKFRVKKRIIYSLAKLGNVNTVKFLRARYLKAKGNLLKKVYVIALTRIEKRLRLEKEKKKK